jgi:starch synthase
MVSSEVAPYSKTGGLGDVTAALVPALARLGHEVTLVTPRYRGITVEGHPAGRLELSLGGTPQEVELFEVGVAPRARILFVDHPPSFDRANLYGIGSTDYPDNALRFALLSQAALGFAARHLRPSVVHAHEWQAGLAPLYLARAGGALAPLAGVPAVFTIHNLAFQGLFPAETLPAVDVDRHLFTIDGVEYWGELSFLKAGINFSELVTTVSPRYAQEILTPELGFGFDGVLAARRDRLVGILNGIDHDTWDPSRDSFLPAHYSARDLTGKRGCKRALLETSGLPADAGALARPLVGMVGRLTDQKGQDLIARAAEELMAVDATFVVVGTGEWRYEEMWTRLAARRPDRVSATVGFDERRAHLVEAGADMFLMPSRFEPCGLNQMYSLRYGTVPIVRATGGLADTVEDFDPATGRGTGFRFDAYEPRALMDAVGRALDAFARPAAWRRLVRAGMRQDHSWDVSAREYVKVYSQAVRGRGRRPARRA